MRSLIYIFLISVMTLGTVACGKKESKRSSIRDARERRGASELRDAQTGTVIHDTSERNYQPISGKVWGEVVRSSQSEFQAAVEGLLSAVVRAEEVGTVSSQSGDSTGVRFWGNVEMERQTFNPNQSTNANIRLGSAELRLSIWDQYSGTTNSNGDLIPEFPIHIKGAADGWVSGNSATIIFEDEYGFIVLEGTFDARSFWGWMSFDNKTSVYPEGQGAAGYLGQFMIETCGFFRCQ